MKLKVKIVEKKFGIVVIPPEVLEKLNWSNDSDFWFEVEDGEGRLKDLKVLVIGKTW